MNYKDALLFVGKCLTLGIHPERTDEVRQDIRSGKIVWEQIVQISSSHLVLPALFIRLEKASLLCEFPADLIEHMRYLTDCNRDRNMQIKNQMNDLITLLNSNGIAPIFLKGTAHMLLPIYDDMGERMVGDIDFLVPEDDFMKTAQLLIDVGYQPQSEFDPALIKATKHYPRLVNFNYPAAVEVHRQVIGPPLDRKFEAKEIIRDKQKIACELELYIPSNEHLIIHNVLHAQVIHQAYLWNDVNLRQMYDLLLLSTKEDTQKVLTRFADFAKPTNAYLAILSMVFDNPAEVNYKNNRSVRFYLKRLNFFLSFSGFFHVAYKSVIYIFWRLSRYVTLPIQSIYRKDVRAGLWFRLKDPQWYKNHLLSYFSFFGPSKLDEHIPN